MLDLLRTTAVETLQSINSFFTEAMNGNELVGGAITASLLASLFYLSTRISLQLLRIVKNKLLFSHTIVFSRGTYGVEYDNQENISAIGTLLERKLYSQNQKSIHSAQILVVNRKLRLSLPNMKNFIFIGTVPVFISKNRKSINQEQVSSIEEITLTIVSLRIHRNVVLNFIKQLNPSTSKPGIYSVTNTTNRVKDLALSPNYILDSEVSSKLDEFINDFLKYRSKDPSHKATLLLYGPPGTGKSTISEYIATKLNSSLFCICPQQSGFNTIQSGDISSYMQLCKKAIDEEEIPILLADDIDVLWPGVDGRAILKKNEDIKNNFEKLNKEAERKTLTNLLRSLQSPVSYSGGIFIMNTNALEKLDSAIYRPGRVQLMLKINKLKPETIRELYEITYDKKWNSEKQIISMRACDVSDLLATLQADEFEKVITDINYKPSDIAFNEES